MSSMRDDPKHKEALQLINERISGKDAWMKYFTRIGYYLPAEGSWQMPFVFQVLKGTKKLLKKAELNT